MTVRDATPRDLDSIQEFLQAYVDEFWDRPYSPDALVARGHAHTGREWHHPRPRPRGPRRSRSVGSVRPRCGWDLALIGLGLPIESGSAVDPETALAFPTSPVGVEFVRHAAASGTWAPCFRAAPAPPDALLRDGAGQLVGEAEAGKAAGHDEGGDLRDRLAVEREHVERDRLVPARLRGGRVGGDRRLPVRPDRDPEPRGGHPPRLLDETGAPVA